jgi:hypothetical protein
VGSNDGGIDIKQLREVNDSETAAGSSEVIDDLGGQLLLRQKRLARARVDEAGEAAGRDQER